MIFAERYIDALERHLQGQPTTRAWHRVFNAADDWWPIVLQHLLLSINAHINLDLGVAAAATSPGDSINDLKADFDRVNSILGSLVGDVERQLTEIWPSLVWLSRIAGDKDDVVINFSIEKARRNAWDVARQLAPLDDAARSATIDRVDAKTTLIGHAIRHPGPLISSVTGYIRLRERGTVREIIDILG